MKKLLMAVILLIVGISANAQTTYFEGSLKEAMALAKKESKMIMIMASATWCGPCKMVEKDILSTKEVGDYLNEKFIFKKYLLDIADPDNIPATYGVGVYPTFIFIDGDGVMQTRTAGGAKTPADFVTKIKDVTRNDNLLIYHEKKYKADPKYALEYLTFLNKIVATNTREQVLAEVQQNIPISEIFTPEWLAFYKKVVRNVSSPVLATMLNKSKEVIAVTGKDAYNSLLSERSAYMLWTNLSLGKFDEVNFEKILATLKSAPAMQNNFYKFVVKNKKSLIDKDIDVIMPLIMKELKKADSDSRNAYLSMIVTFVPKGKIADYRNSLLEIVNTAVSYETNEQYKKNYTGMVDRINKMK